MEQESWNTLFGWLTGRQCFIPEGCEPPLIGVVVYAVFLIALGLVSAALIRREDEIKGLIQGWRR